MLTDDQSDINCLGLRPTVLLVQVLILSSSNGGEDQAVPVEKTEQESKSPTCTSSAKQALDVIAAARVVAEAIGTLPDAIKVMGSTSSIQLIIICSNAQSLPSSK